MSIDSARQDIERGLSVIHAAYWFACDTEGRAIDPEELGAPDGLLDDAFHTALMVEGISQERGITWAEARNLV